jgi:hypothetical protein
LLRRGTGVCKMRKPVNLGGESTGLLVMASPIYGRTAYVDRKSITSGSMASTCGVAILAVALCGGVTNLLADDPFPCPGCAPCEGFPCGSPPDKDPNDPMGWPGAPGPGGLTVGHTGLLRGSSGVPKGSRTRFQGRGRGVVPELLGQRRELNPFPIGGGNRNTFNPAPHSQARYAMTIWGRVWGLATQSILAGSLRDAHAVFHEDFDGAMLGFEIAPALGPLDSNFERTPVIVIQPFRSVADSMTEPVMTLRIALRKGTLNFKVRHGGSLPQPQHMGVGFRGGCGASFPPCKLLKTGRRISGALVGRPQPLGVKCQVEHDNLTNVENKRLAGRVYVMPVPRSGVRGRAAPHPRVMQASVGQRFQRCDSQKQFYHRFL